MVRIPKPIIARKRLWTPGVAPPPRLRGFAFHEKDRLTISDPGGQVTSVDEGAMSATAIISTIQRDRVGDEVLPEGCQLSNYSLNPVVFFGHQLIPFPVGISEDPAGRLSVVIAPGKNILATCYFHQSTLEAAQTFALVTKKIIRATSIGFNPVEEPEKLGEIPGNIYAGYRFNAWELLEWSWVGVGANPGATTSPGVLNEFRDAIRAELSRNRLAGKPICESIRKALQPLADQPKIWANGWTKENPLMSKKWGKPKKKAAITIPSVAFKDGMSEVSGTAGSYVTNSGSDDQPVDLDALKAIAAAFRECAGADTTSDFFFHPEKGVYQTYSEGASPACLMQAKEALAKLTGAEVTQATSPPPDTDGFAKLYSLSASDAADDDDQEDPDDKPGMITKPAGGDVDSATTPDNPLPDPSQPAAKGPDDPNAAPSIPGGAQCAQNIIGYISQAVSSAEPEIVDFLNDILDQVTSWASDRYPDLDFGSGSDDTAQTPASDSATADPNDPANTEETMDRYTGGQPSRSWRKGNIGKRAKLVVREAADYLGDLAQLDDKGFCRTHRAACKSHFRELDELHQAWSKPPVLDADPQQPQPGADDTGNGTDSLDAKAIMDVLGPMNSRVETLGKQWFQLTGQMA